jgi:hypothetical protein
MPRVAHTIAKVQLYDNASNEDGIEVERSRDGVGFEPSMANGSDGSAGV